MLFQVRQDVIQSDLPDLRRRSLMVREGLISSITAPSPNWRSKFTRTVRRPFLARQTARFTARVDLPASFSAEDGQHPALGLLLLGGGAAALLQGVGPLDRVDQVIADESFTR